MLSLAQDNNNDGSGAGVHLPPPLAADLHSPSKTVSIAPLHFSAF